jgi:hypothetical protein
MESLLPMIIQLISGAVGGNAAGSLMKNLSLGTVGNSIVGLLGGGIGGQVMGMLGMGGAAASSGLDIGSILSTVAGGGIGGGVLLAIVGMIKKMLVK